MDTQLAERLQKLRKENGYSQEQLADELQVTRQAVSKWECGDALPDTENLIALSRLYNCSLDDIINPHEEALLEDAQTVGEATAPQSAPATVEASADSTAAHERRGNKIVGLVSSLNVFTSVIAYLLLGTLMGVWHPAWIIFFAIPIVPSIADSIIKKDPKIFCFPVLVTAVYLLLGCQWGLWHPWWVLFLLIPPYYIIIDFVFKRKSHSDDEADCD